MDCHITSPANSTRGTLPGQPAPVLPDNLGWWQWVHSIKVFPHSLHVQTGEKGVSTLITRRNCPSSSCRHREPPPSSLTASTYDLSIPKYGVLVNKVFPFFMTTCLEVIPAKLPIGSCVITGTTTLALIFSPKVTLGTVKKER